MCPQVLFGGFSSNIWGSTLTQVWATRVECAHMGTKGLGRTELEVAVPAGAAHTDPLASF